MYRTIGMRQRQKWDPFELDRISNYRETVPDKNSVLESGL